MKPEETIQSAIISYLRLALPNAIINHAANEGNRGGKQGLIDGFKRKSMGVTSGYPDIVIHVNGITIFMEVKTQTGVLSANQKNIKTILESQGFKYFVVRSIDDAKTSLKTIDWWQTAFQIIKKQTVGEIS